MEASQKAAAARAAQARREALRAIRDARDEVLRDPELGDPRAEREEPQAPIVVGQPRARHGAGRHGRGAGAPGRRGRGRRRRQAPARAADRAASLSAAARAARGRRAGRRRGRRPSQVPAEINLIGLTSTRRCERVDKLLDDAALSERREIRVIHGFGEGKLRRAVAADAEGHPHVAVVPRGRAERGRRRGDDRGAEGLDRWPSRTASSRRCGARRTSCASSPSTSR